MAWASARWLWPRLRGRLPAFPSLPTQGWRGLLADAGLALGCGLFGAWTLLGAWAQLAPARAPMGPDANNFLGCALAFETGRWELYFDDRYPAYPWLVALWAQGGPEVPTAGTELSMLLTVLAAVPLYWLGRELGGRAAGVVGAVLALRQPLALDIGRSFTHYPLAATADATLLALGLALCRTGSPWLALPLGLTGALLFAADPKQVPLVLGTLGFCGLWTLARSPRPLWTRLLALTALVLPLPLTHLVVARYRLELLSLEAITVRTPLNFRSEALREHLRDGFALGEPGAWNELIPSYWRVYQEVLPKGGGVDPGFVEALPMIAANSSAIWLLLLALLPVLLLWRRRAQALPPLVLLALTALSGSSVVRLHYAHRYALPSALQVPPALASSAALLGGPAAAVGLGLGALLPGSPLHRVDSSYLQNQRQHTDHWVGRESTVELEALRWAVAELPQDAHLYDHSQSRPMPILAAGFPYTLCSDTRSTCGEELRDDPGTAVALLWANDFLSGQVAGGERTELVKQGPRMPETVGRCWEHLHTLQPDAALYLWSCEERPQPWPDKRTAPRAPTWGEGAEAGGGAPGDAPR